MPIEVPESSKGDVAHALAKAGLSAVPFVGGPAVELFQLLVQPPLERRRQQWMQQVGEKLLELEAKGLSLEKLQGNEQFVSAAMQASAAAIRTHKKRSSRHYATPYSTLPKATGQRRPFNTCCCRSLTSSLKCTSAYWPSLARQNHPME
ncbi:hypothetical protein LP417_27235 [Polaromonas sp. P1-6]|nr:hypothetical protein LP417_27235 [Polaromonas sp. P1-6]